MQLNIRRYASRGTPDAPWLYGAAIGVAAAAFKLFAPWSEPHAPGGIAEELVGAALAFALLCGIAAALRNFYCAPADPAGNPIGQAKSSTPNKNGAADSAAPRRCWS